ncbi:MAG: glycosyl hydrolase 115 family protein, partial [Acetatifactor sp.]|nr:glycosyl hydrolase 115 family protein [Acetatifactor sp.]
MEVILNRNTHIEGAAADAVRRAASALYRDMRKVFSNNEEEGASICLVEEAMEAEQFFLKAADGKLELHAGDELGFIYGIYEISRSLLGVNDFWFWNDQQFVLKEEQKISEDYFFASKPCAVKYRGWFINDEVLLHTWHVERKKDLPWEMAFEALLRCGGNMVIPGTDRNAERYRGLAASMG